jgi:hypothetical protein
VYCGKSNNKGKYQLHVKHLQTLKVTKPHTPRLPLDGAVPLPIHLTSLDPSTWSRDPSLFFLLDGAVPLPIHLTSLDPSTWSRDLPFSPPLDGAVNSPGHVTPPFSPPLDGAVRSYKR